jgi:hypothetical protein
MKIFYDKTTTVKTNYYKTDIKGLTITEEWREIGLPKISLSSDIPNFSPIFLHKDCFNKKSLMEYRNYRSFLEKHVIEIKSIQNVNKYPLYFCYNAGHMIFDSNMIPMSLPVSFNYISSLRERYPNDILYKRLVLLLKKHAFILNLKDCVIPYYNTDFPGQKGVEHAVALISQKKYHKLYCKYKNNNTTFSVNMKEEISLAYITDLYGEDIKHIIKEFLLKENQE